MEFLKFPKLITARLVLRKLQVEDFTSLVKHANNKLISDAILNIPHPYREPDAAFRLSFVFNGFKKRIRFVFAIVLKDSGKFIGEIGLHFLDKSNNHTQLAYWIAEPYWNQKYATEAIHSVIKFGFEKLNVDLIFADCKESNVASKKVLLKNGMKMHKRNGNLIIYKIEKENDRDE